MWLESIGPPFVATHGKPNSDEIQIKTIQVIAVFEKAKCLKVI